jgi:predicted GNAT superfamily acetyltransferase
MTDKKVNRGFLDSIIFWFRNFKRITATEFYKTAYQRHYTARGYSYLPQYWKDDIKSRVSSPRDLIEIEPEDLFCEIKIIHAANYLYKNNYVKALKQKKKQLTYSDAYGDTRSEEWDRELLEFVKRKESDLNPFDFFMHKWASHFFGDMADVYASRDYESTCSTINILLDDDDDDDDFQSINFDVVVDPYEYESLVAEKLVSIGWSARVTPGSGDQGVDVVATKDDRHIVIQCKLYSQPVGNKAVQEAHAAKGFEQAGEAYVVTNSSYTRSAQQLASSLGVTLLHHSQIEEYFGDPESQDNGFSNVPVDQKEFAIFLKHLFCEIEDAGWEIDKENLSDIESAYEEGELVFLNRDEEETVLLYIRSPTEAELDEAFAELTIEMEDDEESPFESIKIYIVFNGYQTKAQKMLQGFNTYIFNHNQIEEALAILKQ